MNAYSTIRHHGFAAVLVTSLAGILGNALSLDQQAVFERTLTEATSGVVLPEVVVTATRLEA